MTVDGSDTIKYGYWTTLSLPLLLPPVAAEALSLSLNLLDGKISTGNTMVNGKITRVIKHIANATGGVEKIMDTATNADGTTANPVPPDQIFGYHWLKVVDRINTSPAVHAAKTPGSVETAMDTTINASGTATNPLPPDSDTPHKQNNTSTTKICPSNTNTQAVSKEQTSYVIKHQFSKHDSIHTILTFVTPFMHLFQNWKMMHHYAYTNTKLNSPMQHEGNGTMPTIKRTPLKTNTLTITANKVNGATAFNAIAVSIRKRLKRRKRKQ